MGRKRHAAEEVVNMFRQADVEVGKDNTIAEVCKLLAISEQTCCTWRQKYGGLKVDRAKRFEEFEQESVRLKRLLAEADLDKAILREAASKNF